MTRRLRTNFGSGHIRMGIAALLLSLGVLANATGLTAQVAGFNSAATDSAASARTASDPSSGTPIAKGETVRGVNPADNISKFEILPRWTAVDGANSVSLVTTTLKYDRAIQGKYGINFEFPVFARFGSPYGSTNGVGDINLRFRVQGTVLKKIAWVAGLETVWPSASSETLGSGKYQVNPVLAVVYPFSKTVFVAPVIKQFFSVAGAPDRPEIRMGQYRFLAGYSSPKGYWLLADPQFYVNYNNAYHTAHQFEFAPEFEVGKMVAPLVGVWIRGGGHVGGDWTRQQWLLGGGIRFIMIPGM